MLLGRGNGSFSGGRDYPVGDRPEALAGGDISGDGRPDLAVVNLGSTTVRALLNRP